MTVTKLFLLGSFVFASLFLGCGKRDRSGVFRPPFASNSPLIAEPEALSRWGNLKGRDYRCNRGPSPRRLDDISMAFRYTENSDGTLSGDLERLSEEEFRGEVVASYFGLDSSSNDLILLQQVSGPQGIHYNAFLSLCNYDGSYGREISDDLADLHSFKIHGLVKGSTRSRTIQYAKVVFSSGDGANLTEQDRIFSAPSN